MVQLLVQTMEQLNQAHERLMEVARQKQKVLVDGQIEELSRLVQEESRIVRQIGPLEKERMFQIQEYVRSQGQPAEDITMEELLNLVSSPTEKEALHSLASKLHQTLTELRTQNQLNMRLTQDSLDSVNHSLELLTAVQDLSPNYDHPRQQAQEKKQGSGGQRFFDTQA